jgi:hypothetical protein
MARGSKKYPKTNEWICRNCNRCRIFVRSRKMTPERDTVMGKEASLWDLLRRELGPFAHFERVENRVNEGTPDVNYCFHGARGEGWLELKDIESWPARPDTIVHIEHVTEVQRAWWRARRAAGGARVCPPPGPQLRRASICCSRG